MTETTTNPVDASAMEAFGNQLLSNYVGAATTTMIGLGHRTGLFSAAADGPATSADLAARAGLSERHVREWLGAVTTAGIFRYDPTDDTYRLPAEHAPLLTGETALNQAVIAEMFLDLSRYVDAVEGCFREGGGVPYDVYRPQFTEMMDTVGRWRYDALLVDGYLPLVPGLVDLLQAGTALADIGCGTGHCINLMARRFPSSSFVGFDFADDAIARARAEAADWGLANARFEVLDVRKLPTTPTFGVVTAFDAIHDQADPAGVLAGVHAALEPGGHFVMVDVRASSNLEDNVANPLAPMIYTISVLHCMEVSLALDGAGLGTAWGEQLACRMLEEAGFVDLSVHELEDDPFNLLYASRRPELPA